MEKSWKFSSLFVKTKTKTLCLKTKTLLFVLKVPRDEDFGLEDYITGCFWSSVCYVTLAAIGL